MSQQPIKSLRAVLRGIANNDPIAWGGLPGELRPSHAALLPELRAIWQIGRAHASEPAAVPPETWGDLRLLARLGGGAFGDVYRAWDPHLAREVALKILKVRDPRARDPGVVAEGHLLTRVRHPNVVTVHGASRADGQVGFWMELVDGTTLEDVARTQGPLAASVVADIGGQLCAGVQALHDAGLVHGDIKPQNVMREASGRIVLMDLGAADDLQARRGLVAATPRYMAPELAQGHLPDQRSDVYSVGVLLYRLATGRYPADPAEPARLARDDAALHGVLARACAPSRAARPASATALAQMLTRATSALGTAPRARARARVAAGILAAAVAGVLGALAWSESGVASPPTTPKGAGVLVGQVVNQTGIREIEGLEHVIERELLAAPAIPVVARSRVEDALALMQASPDTRLAEPVAREVALRDGAIGRYVTGTVSLAGGRHVVELGIGDPIDGRRLAVVRETSSAVEHVPAVAQRLARRLRPVLAAASASSTAPERLEPVTTRSLAALRLYSRAYVLGDRGEWLSALALVRDALDEQPKFAAARIWLAWALANTGAPKETYLAEARTAMASVQGASLWERRWIQGSYHTLANEYETAIPEYLALIQLRPDVVWSYGNLVHGYQELGRDLEMPWSLLSAAADRNPHSTRLNVMAVTALLSHGQFDAAERHAARVRASAVSRPLRATLPNIHAVLLPAEAALRRGDVSATMATLRSVETSTTFEPGQAVPVTIELFWSYLRMGRISDAERMLDRITPLRDSHLYGALLAHFSGERARVRRELAGAMVDRPDGDGQWPVIAWLQVQVGDLQSARRSNGRARVPTRYSTSGQVLLAEGRHDEAIQALSSDVRGLGPGIYWRTHTALAQAWAAKGDHARAAATLGALEGGAAAFTPMNHVAFRAQAYLTLAEAYLHVGRQASARRVLEHMHVTLAASEPGSILKQRLEALAARLGGRYTLHSDAPVTAIMDDGIGGVHSNRGNKDRD